MARRSVRLTVLVLVLVGCASPTQIPTVTPTPVSRALNLLPTVVVLTRLVTMEVTRQVTQEVTREVTRNVPVEVTRIIGSPSTPQPPASIVPATARVALPSSASPLVPSATPQPPQPAPARVLPWQTGGDNTTSFQSYVRSTYGSINSQPLDIIGVNVTDLESLKALSIELSRKGDTTFAAQPEIDARAYGLRLLRDTMDFFGNKDCSAYVKYVFYDDSISLYLRDRDWFNVGDYSVKSGGFRITEYYVKAYHLRGSDSVEVWNYK